MAYVDISEMRTERGSIIWSLFYIIRQNMLFYCKVATSQKYLSKKTNFKITNGCKVPTL